MGTATDYIKKMLDSAKTRRNREDLLLGEYRFVILGLTHERREKREKLGKAFWIDVVVDEAEKVGDSEPTQVGARLSFPLVLEGQYADMAFSDLKTFLVQLTGCADDETSQKWAELVDVVSDEGKHSNPAQPARGMAIRATTYSRKTMTGKNAGKERTYPRWHRIDQSAGDIAECRKLLDSEG